MKTMAMARRLMELGEVQKALEGFELALKLEKELAPAEKMEAALFVLQFGGDYTLAYRAFLELNHGGYFAGETAAIMTEAFYIPNEKQQRSHYENNCRQLKKYKYMFRKDFVPFEQLPVRFYPFDEKSYVPYYVEEDRFGEITDFSEPVITRNFFHDLEKPILAEDVYSQYELEYLNDNVRPSEWVARENHIYLHYTDWALFCAHLQVLRLRKMLAGEKLVFLFEDEIARYPIDFKEQFGIDYSRYPVKPLGVREINRLIWHTQLSYHNGGDFFNEVLDGHPNLVCTFSLLNSEVEAMIDDVRSTLDDARSFQEIVQVFDEADWGNPRMIQELYRLRDRTDKDIMVAYFFRDKRYTSHLDPAARIAPALMYQPHFEHIQSSLTYDEESGRAIMQSEQYDAICGSRVFRGFKYIKTFVPMRRITTSHAAAMRFMSFQPDYTERGLVGTIRDEVVGRVTFRGYMADEQQRLFKDSVVVRFEDGKLNPRAVFTALANFLDIPYSESMTYCSLYGEQKDEIVPGNVQGFDTASVYRTYDEFATKAERAYLEYFLREDYEYYGYDFQYYDGGPVSEERVKEWVEHFDVLNYYIRKTMGLAYIEAVKHYRKQEAAEGVEYAETIEEEAARKLEAFMRETDDMRMFVARILKSGIRFVNENGHLMRRIPLLALDPALLEQPLYH